VGDNIEAGDSKFLNTFILVNCRNGDISMSSGVENGIEIFRIDELLKCNCEI